MAEVERRVKEFRQGPPLTQHVDCGAITMPGQLDIIERLVEDAKTKGAKAIVGGRRNAQHADGQFYEPTVLLGCTHEMKVVSDEAFGPIMAVLKWSDDEEVIRMANDSDYGLSAVVFTSDYARSERFASALVAGTIIVNDFGIPYLIQDLPFGGVKVSGFGKFNGPEGLRAFSREKAVVTDRFPFRPVPPRFTLYPIPKSAYEITKAGLHAIYDSSVFTRLKNAARAVRLLLTSSE